MRTGAAARRACALLAAVMLAGCAASPELRQITDDDERPARALVSGVPFYPQRAYQCGPASLAMAMNAGDARVEVEDLVPAVFLPGRQGSVQPEMMAAPRRYGQISYPVGGSLDALLHEVDAGRPVIVLQNLGLRWVPLWHYAVVIGYDLERGEVILHSGTSEAMRMSLQRFDRTWARSNRWAMLVLPPGEVPVTTNVRTTMTAINDFEQVAGAAAAVAAWVAATDHWPEHELAWFARGNAHYARQELMEARQAFEKAVELRPDLAPGWVNLGMLYSELGEVQHALVALRAAAVIDGPWQPAAEAALERLHRTPTI